MPNDHIHTILRQHNLIQVTTTVLADWLIEMLLALTGWESLKFSWGSASCKNNNTPPTLLSLSCVNNSWMEENVSYIFPTYALLSIKGLVQALKQACVWHIILWFCVSFKKKKCNSYLGPSTDNLSSWWIWYNITKVKTLTID